MGSPRKEPQLLLEDFPIEVIECISKYLSTHDLNSCCTCSSQMREMFNDDLIWKKRCNKELAVYLEKTACKVKPVFSITPLLKNESLSPLSKWKVAFMRETHLLNNWRQGKYVKEEIKNNQTGRDQYVNFHTFLSNDNIIAVFDNRFEILDVRQFPANLLANVDCYGTTKRGFKIKFWQNCIICSVDSAVQVFQLHTTTNVCKLKHLFFFEDDEPVELTSTNQVRVDIESHKTKPMLHVVLVGSVIVGVYQNESVMHLWNVETGKKIMKVQPFLKNSRMTDIVASSTKNLIICLSDKSKPSLKYCGVYSLTTFKYLKFQEKIPQGSTITVNGNFVAVWNPDKTNMEIFDFVSSSQVMCVERSRSSPHIFRNGFVCDAGDKLALIDVSSKKVQILSEEGKAVRWFEVLSDKFIQVRRSSSYSLEVWEVHNDSQSKKTTAMNIYFQMCAYFFNNVRTRYIVREAVGNVMHFW